jgi:hypothetical protein
VLVGKMVEGQMEKRKIWQEKNKSKKNGQRKKI